MLLTLIHVYKLKLNEYKRKIFNEQGYAIINIFDLDKFKYLRNIFLERWD